MSTLGTQTLLRIHRPWLTTIGCLFLLLAAAAIAQDLTRSLAGAERAVNAADSPLVTKVYSLKHATGEQVVSLLRSLFIVVDQQNAYARFQFDERTDSLIVAASAQRQKEIARILALVDTPGTPPAGAVSGDESGRLVKGYPIKVADGDAAVSVLRSLFLVVNHRVAYARFAYDSRTSLLIAIASERHHKQIADVLELLASPAAHAKETANESDGNLPIRVYSIKHIGGEQLVSKLRSQFVVVNHEQAQTRFGFDERTRSLIVIATGKLHTTIRDTLAVLDQPPERNEAQPKTGLTTCEGLSAAAAPRSVDPQAASIECVLRADRNTYHPGEAIDLQGYVKNSGRVAVKLPGLDFARQYAVSHLHVRTPSGDEFTYEPYAEHPLRSELTSISPKSFTTALAPGQEHSAFRKGLRVTRDLTRWSSREHARGPLSLRAAGEYRIWFDYRVPALTDAPQDAWLGTATSNTLVVTVVELPPGERREKPTTEQVAAIQTLQSVAPTSIEGHDLLQQAMLHAESEGLAEHLVNLCLQDARRGEDFIAMVSLRACNADPEEGHDGRLQLGIDGPYLKTLAFATIETIEHPPRNPNKHRLLRFSYALDATIAYLRFHPEDQVLRRQLVGIAVQNAKLPASSRLRLPPRAGTADPWSEGREQQQLRVPSAWMVLLELEVLRAGMTAEAAIEILGPPSRRTRDSLAWYLDSPRHVNPGLAAAIEAGKVKSFRRSSRY